MDNLAKPTNRALFLASVAVTGAFAGAAVWLFFFAMEHGIVAWASFLREQAGCPEPLKLKRWLLSG